MTVQELQSHTDFAPRWTEACPVEHSLGEMDGPRRRGAGPTGRPGAVPAGARNRPPTRPQDRRASATATVDRVRPVAPRQVGPGRPAGRVSVAPDRRVLARPSVDARACHVAAPARAGVVDDVPTWALLACGVLVGVLMLLALAFLGGPAYA